MTLRAVLLLAVRLGASDIGDDGRRVHDEASASFGCSKGRIRALLESGSPSVGHSGKAPAVSRQTENFPRYGVQGQLRIRPCCGLVFYCPCRAGLRAFSPWAPPPWPSLTSTRMRRFSPACESSSSGATMAVGKGRPPAYAVRKETILGLQLDPRDNRAESHARGTRRSPCDHRADLFGRVSPHGIPRCWAKPSPSLKWLLFGSSFSSPPQ